MKFYGREAFQIENEKLRVTVLREGCHIVEVLHKAIGVNPLWIPPWASTEPSTFDRAQNANYGTDMESKLLSGLMGHNVCVDVFGPPSSEEFAAGLDVHGESSVVPYKIAGDRLHLEAIAELPLANLCFTRTLTLQPGSESVEVCEYVENRSGTDRPIAWTQHVTIGPPFLQHGVTQLNVPAMKSRTFESSFGLSNLQPGANFEWPHAPKNDGDTKDLSIFTREEHSAGYTAHLLQGKDTGASFFSAFSPSSNLLFGYRGQRTDFPWLGMWEENRSRTGKPWDGNTVALGLEFGVSPFPETRKEMINRGSLFGIPTYRWLPAKSKAEVSYEIFANYREQKT